MRRAWWRVDGTEIVMLVVPYVMVASLGLFAHRIEIFWSRDSMNATFSSEDQQL
jgi:hypothetical protein